MSVVATKRKRTAGGDRFESAIQDPAVLERAHASVEDSLWHVNGAPSTKNGANRLLRDLTNFTKTAYRNHENYEALKTNVWADGPPPLIDRVKAFLTAYVDVSRSVLPKRKPAGVNDEPERMTKASVHTTFHNMRFLLRRYSKLPAQPTDDEISSWNKTLEQHEGHLHDKFTLSKDTRVQRQASTNEMAVLGRAILAEVRNLQNGIQHVLLYKISLIIPLRWAAWLPTPNYRDGPLLHKHVILEREMNTDRVLALVMRINIGNDKGMHGFTSTGSGRDLSVGSTAIPSLDVPLELGIIENNKGYIKGISSLEDLITGRIKVLEWADFVLEMPIFLACRNGKLVLDEPMTYQAARDYLHEWCPRAGLGEGMTSYSFRRPASTNKEQVAGDATTKAIRGDRQHSNVHREFYSLTTSEIDLAAVTHDQEVRYVQQSNVNTNPALYAKPVEVARVVSVEELEQADPVFAQLNGLRRELNDAVKCGEWAAWISLENLDLPDLLEDVVACFNEDEDAASDTEEPNPAVVVDAFARLQLYDAEDVSRTLLEVVHRRTTQRRVCARDKLLGDRRIEAQDALPPIETDTITLRQQECDEQLKEWHQPFMTDDVKQRLESFKALHPALSSSAENQHRLEYIFAMANPVRVTPPGGVIPPCDECDLVFKSRRDYDLHLAQAHSEDAPQDALDAREKVLASKRNHMRRAHKAKSDAQAFPCTHATCRGLPPFRTRLALTLHKSEDHGGHNPNAKFICPASSCGKAFTRQYLKTHYGKEHEDEDDWDSVKNSLRPASASGVASVTVKSEPAPRRLLLFISEDDYETLLKRPHIVAKRPSERPVRCSKCEGLSSNARHFRAHMEVCDGRVAYAESTHQSMQTPASSSSSSISQVPLTKKRKLTEVSANAQPDRQGSTVSASRYTVSDPGTFSTIQWSTSSSTLTYTLSTFSGSRSSSNTPPNYTITSFSENGWATSSPEQLASFKGVL